MGRLSFQDMRSGTTLSRVTRRQALVFIGACGVLVAGVPVAWTIYDSLRFPSEQTPEGAYLRIVLALNQGRDRDVFSFLEEDAQNAICTIHEYRARALAKVRASFEEPERSQWEANYREEGDADGPSALWAILAARHGWLSRLRSDLSGIAAVERVGKRATVVTTRATRYPFREAERGFWGLTLFTAEIVAQKDRAPRDYLLVEQAAADYERVRKR